MTTTSVTPMPHHSHRSAFIFALAAVLLIVIVFLCARSEGTKAGQRDAREKIESENNLTAGPKSLI